eukprot:Em0020g26a
MAEEENMDTSGDPVSAGATTVVERVVRMSLRQPPRFGAKGDWKLWLSRFEMYATQAKIAKDSWSKEPLSLLEDEPYRMVTHQGLAQTGSELEWQLKVRTRVQKVGESLMEFCGALRGMADKAFPAWPAEQLQDLLRNQFIQGVLSSSVQLALMKEEPKTLDDALKLACKHEMVETAQKHLQMLRQKEVVALQKGSWSSPAVLVKKKDGSTRFCVDFRQLNAVTKKDAQPLPRIDETLDVLGSARWFSCLDLTSGYWQVEVAPEDLPCQPFGLTNAPATFQCLMERVLAGLHWTKCLIYLDDILIFSATVQQHFTRLREIFARLKQAGLKIKPIKLTEKGHVWHWSSDCDAAFLQLKERLVTSPILGYPVFNQPFMVDADASGKGLGAVLSQKPPPAKLRAPLQLDPAVRPLQRVAMDIMGPLPETSRGNKYILVIADYFTKWSEAYPIPNMEAITVAKCLVNEFICRFGVPEQLHSDQGRNFESKVIKNICDLLQIRKTRTSPYHSQSDGLVERFNRTLLNLLSIAVVDAERDWDVQLPLLMFAYRTSMHETNGVISFEMMFGREVVLPEHLMFNLPVNIEQVPQEGVEYVDYLKKRFQLVHQYVRQNAQKGMQRQKTGYDQKENTRCVFRKGDHVWLYTPAVPKGKSPKFHRPWQGPYQILRKKGEVTYDIRCLAHPRKRLVVHYNRLKPFLQASPHGEQESSEEEEKGTPSEEQDSRGEEIEQESRGEEINKESMADLQDEQYIYVESRRPEPGPAVEEHVPPSPLIAPAPRQPHNHLLSRNYLNLENSCVVQLGTDILQTGMGTLLFILLIPIQTVRTLFHWMGSCVMMATAVSMSNTTSDSLTTELSRTVVPCALKNNSWLVYN